MARKDVSHVPCLRGMPVRYLICSLLLAMAGREKINSIGCFDSVSAAESVNLKGELMGDHMDRMN